MSWQPGGGGGGRQRSAPIESTQVRNQCNVASDCRKSGRQGKSTYFSILCILCYFPSATSPIARSTPFEKKISHTYHVRGTRNPSILAKDGEKKNSSLNSTTMLSEIRHSIPLPPPSLIPLRLPGYPARNGRADVHIENVRLPLPQSGPGVVRT